MACGLTHAPLVKVCFISHASTCQSLVESRPRETSISLSSSVSIECYVSGSITSLRPVIVSSDPLIDESRHNAIEEMLDAGLSVLLSRKQKCWGWGWIQLIVEISVYVVDAMQASPPGIVKE